MRTSLSKYHPECYCEMSKREGDLCVNCKAAIKTKAVLSRNKYKGDVTIP